jgi:hypothetical protein
MTLTINMPNDAAKNWNCGLAYPNQTLYKNLEVVAILRITGFEIENFA